MVEPPVGRTRSRLWPKPQQLILELVRPNHTDGYWLPAPSGSAAGFEPASPVPHLVGIEPGISQATRIGFFGLSQLSYTDTQIIADCVHKGKFGGGLMIMDAGKATDLPHYCSSNRVPAWMLPHLGAEDTQRMRPDILFVPNLPSRVTRRKRYQGPGDKSKHTVYIIEVGYTGDLQHAEKLAQKTTQHEKLAAELRKAGWEVCYTETQNTHTHTHTAETRTT